MSSDDIAIRVSNLSKCYEIYETPRDRLKQFILPRLQQMSGTQSKKYYREFWALKDVSFELKKGETFGIIGRNGSGKSTLLQAICGTLMPSNGNVETKGRIAALLELGSGFNPEFTGRENIYLNGSVLGLSKEEIDSRFDEIVAFADIGDFIEQPVKTYSSGMYVRLAYAVIAHVGADILVIDEALAVGDVFFQQKCMRHLRSFKNLGGTVIFVSHDTSAITNLCERVVLLERGTMVDIGSTDRICQRYLKSLYAERAPRDEAYQVSQLDAHTGKPSDVTIEAEYFAEGSEQTENVFQIGSFQQNTESFGCGGMTILDVWFENTPDSRADFVRGEEPISLCLRVFVNQPIKHPAFGFMLKDRLGQYVFAEGTDLAFRNHALMLSAGKEAIARFSFTMPILIQGEYTLNVAASEGIGDDHIQHHWIHDAIVLKSVNSRLVHGLCGVQNLNLSIQLTMISEGY